MRKNFETYIDKGIQEFKDFFVTTGNCKWGLIFTMTGSLIFDLLVNDWPINRFDL